VQTSQSYVAKKNQFLLDKLTVVQFVN